MIDKERTVGFTGTQKGMTKEQLANLGQELIVARNVINHGFGLPIYFRHGNCIGADHEASIIANNLFYTVIAHPGDNPDKQVAENPANELVLPHKKNISRNHDIVAASIVTICCPGSMTEVRRSGTWATIRYCHYYRKSHIIFYPDGTEERYAFE